jgi:AraC family ethanolamine operon transcriptional activator
VPGPERLRLARRAEEFMRENLRRGLLMAELCQEMNVSERALRYAFEDCFGVSPLAYFKALKLNAVHRQIRRAGPARARVQEVARQWGIVHMGNFAADYRRLFGEAPSTTARQAREIH